VAGSPVIGRQRGVFSTLLRRPGLRASSDGVLATKSERKMLASTCLYSLYAWFNLYIFDEGSNSRISLCCYRYSRRLKQLEFRVCQDGTSTAIQRRVLLQSAVLYSSHEASQSSQSSLLLAFRLHLEVMLFAFKSLGL